MQYALLIYADRSKQRPPEDADRTRAAMEQVVDDAQAAGVLASVARLEPASQARTARPAAASVAFTDGPFAETKEQLAGFCLLDCRDDAEAREWASRFAQAGCPSAIEIRAVAWNPQRVESPESELAAI